MWLRTATGGSRSAADRDRRAALGVPHMAWDIERYREAERRLWASVGATPTERFVTLATGERVRVQELGDGPPVVFIHGGAVAGTSWAHLAAALPDFRCLLVDRPGCGLSDPVAGGRLRDLDAFQRYADGFLGRLLDALELERANVAATSLGGLFAFRGVAAVPGRVDRLVEYSWLMGAPVEGVPFSARLASLPGAQALAARVPMTRSMVKKALTQFGLGRAIESGKFDDDMLDWAHALLRETPTMRNEMASMPDVVTPIKGVNRDLLLTDQLLAKLTMPVLFLWGEGDPNGGAAVARDFAPRLPDAELVIVPDAEHSPWIDDLDFCVDHTRRFLTT